MTALGPTLKEQQAAWLDAWRQRGDVRARDLLVASVEGLVIRLARERQRRTGLDLDDLLQAARLGAFLAVEKCDPQRGGYPAIAWQYIRAELTNYASHQLAHLATSARKARRADVRSLGAPRTKALDGDGGESALWERPDPMEWRSQVDRLMALARALGDLEPRELDAVMRSYYREETLAEIGGRWGLTGNRASQIRAKALARARARLSDAGLAFDDLV